MKRGIPMASGYDYYLVCRVKSAPEFAHNKWNMRQLLKRRGIAEIASP